MRLALNKNSLKQQRDHLALYQRFLPSLDLKRRQLIAAWKDACRELEQAEREQAAYQSSLAQLLPLLGSSTLKSRDLTLLVRVKQAVIGEKNVAGARVPVLQKVEFERAEYSTLTLPFWVDRLVESIEHMARLRLQLRVLEARTERLGAAMKKITQRVNLFEKVLIPSTRDNIKRIQIALNDEVRASVVRSKLAKNKHR